MRFEYSKWAIPVLLMGVALFFTNCQLRTYVKKAPVEKVQTEQFYRAEEYRKSGDADLALEYYEAYIKGSPAGENVPVALHRTGDIYFEKGEYNKALDAFKRIISQYTDYAELPSVEYKKVHAIYLLGDFRLAINEGLNWLETYPWHKLEPQVAVLIGDSYKESGSLPRAFDWWLRAERIYQPDSIHQNVLSVKIESVIEESNADDLERIVDYAVESRYAPVVLFRLASLYFENNEIEKAGKVAESLIDSSPDPEWVKKGYKLLETIRKGTSIKKGSVGCLLPLSGPFAIYGEEVLNGIQLGMGLFRGGGNDKYPELIIRDTKGDPDEAVKGLKELVEEEKVMAVIGPLSSRAALPVAKEAQKLKVPLIALTQKKDITSEGDMIFRNFMTPAKEVEKVVSLAIGELGLRRFAILYPDNSYGKYLMSLFWDRLSEMGGIVTAVESYAENETDFADQIKKMTGLYYPRIESEEEKKKREASKDSDEPAPVIDFDAIFIPDGYQNIAMIAAHLVYHDVKGARLIGTSLWQSSKLIEMGGDYLQGAIFTSGYSEVSNRPGAQEFAKVYREAFESAPGVLAATGYDTIRFLKDVIMTSDIKSRTDLQKAIVSHIGFEGITGTIYFDADGEVQKDPQVLTVSRNQITLFRK
ncbi:penicillin-binding protein activator [Thermodesulfobacteriota bacterium]